MPIPILAIVAGAAIAWNLLTDWVWIGGSFGIMPETEKKDIQKRAIAIIQLIDDAKSVVYSAQKLRRRPNSSEIALIKANAASARRQLAEMKAAYQNKFALYGKAGVIEELNRTASNIELQLQNMEVIAGLRLAARVTPTTITRTATKVIDGDTITLSPDPIPPSPFGLPPSPLRLALAGPAENVRLVGIDAPESTTDDGQRAKAYLKSRIEGKLVRIESDPNALTDIYGRRLGVIYLGDVNINIEMLRLGYAKFYDFEPNALVIKKTWQAVVPTTGGAATSTPIKVFTGVVLQGKLGSPVQFVPRESDMIEDVGQLRVAAMNNLASFIVSLPGKIVYELKIVSSVTSRDGFITRGKTQRVVVGRSATGITRYRTITNKFAQLNVYFVTYKGIKTKVDTINLGPVDAAKFVPTPEQLGQTEEALRRELITSDVETITSIVTPGSVVVQPPVPTPVLPTYVDTAGVATVLPPPRQKTQGEIYDEALLRRGYSKLYKQPSQWTIMTESGAVREVLNGQKLATLGFNFTSVPDDYQFPSNVSGGGISADVVLAEVNRMIAEISPTVEPTDPLVKLGLPPSNNPNRCAAATISLFFDVNRVQYPLLAERAKLYEEWGLGPASLYLGTAEQNNRWLAEAKKRSGC